MPTISITGDKELIRRFNRLATEAGHKLALEAAMAGAQFMKPIIEHQAPKPTKRKRPESVPLHRAIGVEAFMVGGMPAVKAGVDIEKSSIGHLVELGHDIVKGGKKGRGGQVVGRAKPNRFMQRSFDIGADGASSVMREALWAGIKWRIRRMQ